MIALSMNGMKALGAGVSAIAGIGVVAAGMAAAIGWRLSRAGTIREAEPHAE